MLINLESVATFSFLQQPLLHAAKTHAYPVDNNGGSLVISKKGYKLDTLLLEGIAVTQLQFKPICCRRKKEKQN